MMDMNRIKPPGKPKPVQKMQQDDGVATAG